MTLPLFGEYLPKISLINVVFPVPLLPIIATRSFSKTLKVMSEKISSVGNENIKFVTLNTDITLPHF